MFKLFALPGDIVLTLLSQWLGLRELCAVDSAVCNQILRPTFLNYLSDDAFVLTQNIHKSIHFNNKGVNWLSSRCIGVESINLVFGVSLNRFPVDYSVKKGRFIKQCSMRCCDKYNVFNSVNWMIDVATYCTNLEVVSQVWMTEPCVEAF